MQPCILSHSIQVNRHGDLSFVMTQRLEKCFCVQCYFSVKPQSDRLVEDKFEVLSRSLRGLVSPLLSFVVRCGAFSPLSSFAVFRRTAGNAKNICFGSGYLRGPIQISAWFIVLSLHANPDPESVTKYNKINKVLICTGL